MSRRRVRFVPAPSKAATLLARNPVFRALGQRPIGQREQITLALAARQAFESIAGGNQDVEHRHTLALMVNLVLVLVERHSAAREADEALAKEAQAAILRADERAARGLPFNFDGPGREAILDALEAHEELIGSLGVADVSAALAEVDARQARGDVFRPGDAHA